MERVECELLGRTESASFTTLLGEVVPATTLFAGDLVDLTDVADFGLESDAEALPKITGGAFCALVS